MKRNVRIGSYLGTGAPERHWWLRHPGVDRARDVNRAWFDRPRPPIVVRSRRSVGDFSPRPAPAITPASAAAQESDLKAFMDRLASAADAAARRAARLERHEACRMEFRRKELDR